MIVVSDTTPIISLIKINQLYLLEKLFKNVKVPMGVYEELTTNSLYQEEVELIKQCSFIEIVSVNELKSVAILRKTTGLDRGESEAIVLAGEILADLLLIDERKGRQIAKQIGITIVGTLGILLSAYEDNILTKEMILDCIGKMKYSGLRISNSLYNELLKKIYP